MTIVMLAGDPVGPGLISRGPTGGEAIADSATKSHATEIAIPIHAVIIFVIFVLRETNARPSSRARQSSECLVGLWGKPLIRTHRVPISGIFQT